MAEFELEDAGVGNGRVNGHAAAPSRAVATVAPRSAPTAPTAPSSDERSTLSGYVAELDFYYAGMNTFEAMEPDEVMQKIGAMVARLTEIRARLHRLGTTRATQLRTKEVDPLLDSLRLLFQVHSRLLASRQFDFEVTRGAV